MYTFQGSQTLFILILNGIICLTILLKVHSFDLLSTLRNRPGHHSTLTKFSISKKK